MCAPDMPFDLSIRTEPCVTAGRGRLRLIAAGAFPWLLALALALAPALALTLALTLAPSLAQAQDRIGVRVVEGEGEFFNTVTGESFRPRGVNYLEFRPAGYYREDRVLAVGGYDEAVIAQDFRNLRAEGYDTVRIFFDHCSNGRACMTRQSVAGLNPAYMDNFAALTRLAAREGIYLVLTSNDIPDHGGYGELANREASDLFAGYRNAHFMSASGVAAFEAYWGDIMAALAARDTNWSAVLGWSILNEEWIFKDQPPWSLTSGVIRNGTGASYDLSDPAQKRAALSDNLVLISTRVRDIVRATDPDALVGMGFFVPQFPVPTGIGGDWYVDTEPLLAAAPLDFFDFHAYYDADLDIDQITENFGMPAHPDRPVIMGEVGSSPGFIPRAETALRMEQEWMARSCELGWDGWLHWGYKPFPPGVDTNPPYTLTGLDGMFLRGLSPARRPDPCFQGNFEPHVNLAIEATARASRSLPGRGPELALDGKETGWESGDDAPGWIEITLAEPSRLAQVSLWVAQWPAGRTRTRVTATLAGGGRLRISDRTRDTEEGMMLRFDLPGGVPDVTGIRIEILSSPSWVALHEVELLRDRGQGPACLVGGGGAVNLRGDPSTDHPAVGRLDAGQVAQAVARVAGQGELPWLRLSDGSFVRSDVVRESAAGCDALPDR